jgi:membrane-associated phospholipid phosphatase
MVWAVDFGAMERDVLYWVTCKLYAPWLDPILIHAQEKTIAVPLTIGMLLLLALKRPRRALRAAIACAAGFGLAALLATILWNTVDRARPPHVYEELLTTKEAQAACAAKPDALVVRKSISRSPSFPSRHGLTVGVFVAVLLLASRPLGFLAILYGILVAVGRVYGAKHWPSDVIAGVGLGLLCGWVAWKLVPKLVALLPHGPVLEEPEPPSV